MSGLFRSEAGANSEETTRGQVESNGYYNLLPVYAREPFGQLESELNHNFH